MRSASEWLGSIGLGQYAQVFADNCIDLVVIASLTEEDLEKLGVPMGHRKKLLKAICEFGKGAGVNSSQAPSPLQYTPAHLAEKILTSKSALEGERKLVSVLFCDIAQSTELAARIGADAMHTLLNRFFNLALAEVHRFEGTINQFLGDGFMALFGAPLAHEDHVRRALLAALAIQHRLREASDEEPNLRDTRIRMGVNTGMVVVGKIGDNLRMDYTAVGDTTNLAARLEQSAQADTIRVSAAVQRATAAWFEFKPLGQQALRGIAEPIELYEVVKARAANEAVVFAQTRGIGSALVGRDQELALLTASLKSLHRKQGGIVLLTGEPGVGKSRLLAEARRSVDAAGIRWLEGRSLSFGRNLSYRPFIEILKQVFDIEETDAEAQAWSKLEHGCVQLFAERAEELVPYLGTVLALGMKPHEQRIKYLDPQALGRQVFWSMRQLFEQLAARQPMLVLMEDWHWVDQSSVALCEHLLPLSRRCALGIWFAARPEPKEPMAQIRTAAGAGDKLLPVEEITLTPLAEVQSDLLLDNLVGADKLPSALRAQILRKTEGNPFFIEEIIQAMITEGVLVQEPHTHAWRLSKPVESFALPNTVQAVIAARIDRLEDGVKDVLKLASVIGRGFFFRILQAISAVGSALDGNLGYLQKVELIRQRQQLPELEYVFKHALVQEAAYDSIVTDRRRAIHRAVAQAIETLFAERLEEFTSTVAYHYARAEDWDKAQQYLFKAGELAGRMAADVEALEHYRQAIIAHERAFGGRWAPMQRARLHRQMGEALFRIGRLPQALTFLDKALTDLGRPYPSSRGRVRTEMGTQLLRRLLAVVLPRATWLHTNRVVPDPEIAMEAFRAVLALGWIHVFQDGERMALDILRLARYSDESGDPEHRAVGTGYLGLLFNMLGMHTIARHYHERASRIATECGSPVALGHTSFAYGHGGYYAGRWEEALANVEKGAAIFRSIRNYHLWGGPAIWTAILLLAIGDSRSTAISQEIMDVGIETGDSQLQGWGLLGLGMSFRHAGEYDKAIHAFEATVSIFQSISDPYNLTLILAETALCFARSGRFEQGLQLADRVMSRVKQGNPRGLWMVHAHGPAAETYVLAAGSMRTQDEPRKRWLLEKAFSVARDAVRQGSGIRSVWAAHSLRLLGSCLWLRGDHSRAKEAWRRAAATAEQLGAHYALAEIHLETGLRLDKSDDIERAVELFKATGFVLRATEAREHLSFISKRVADPSWTDRR